MTLLFYIAAVVAIISTLMVITRLNAVHALLYLIVSLFSVSVMFLVLGAPFIAVLEIIVYAGAIMVLFIFVVMMLNLGGDSVEAESKLLSKKIWIGPAILTSILLIEFIYIVTSISVPDAGSASISPKQVGISLFGTYALGVQLAGMLLMAGIIGAYHIGRSKKTVHHRFLEEGEN